MRRILVLDDKACGFRVATADGSANGLAALADASFDLMIVDVFMPTMRGFESIRLFHQRAPTVPLMRSPATPFPAPKRTIRPASKWFSTLG
jgi:CheY-like chemotaxis protein